MLVTGTLLDTECIYLVHQNSLQLLCYIEKNVPEPRKIGFIYGGKKVER